jgi:CubicO group peptidase (beta-lactamase class C family)
LLPPMAIRRSTWRVDRLMSDELAAASIPDAAIAITRGDQVLRVRGYGHDVDDVPDHRGHASRIASLSKSLRLWPSSNSWMPAGCPWTIFT